jgi:ABC-type nitrate/sulfonate/bicarbonate transport system ATPase subunit
MTELKICRLSRTFPAAGGPGIAAVKDLSLTVPAGSFTVILGASGCGKTTLLKLIAGLEKPDGGTLLFAGNGGTRRPGAAPRIGFMFQDARLLPWLTVEENLRLAFRRGGPERETEINGVLDLVGLGAWKTLYPRKLSGGMAQRVALARALCRKPRLLLLDEPFGSLDALTRTRLRRELDALWRTLRITVILVTHDIEEAVYLGDRVVLMRNGGVGEEIPVSLARPRECRSGEFQDYCRIIEEGLQGESFPDTAGTGGREGGGSR